MSQDPLRSAFAKIKRAETHIRDLEVAVRTFLNASPYKLVSEVNADRTEEVWSIKVDCIPEDIESIAMDAIHNLRVPLDKMLTIGADAANLRQIKFPTGQTKERFEASLANQRKHLSESVVDFLRATQAHPGGSGALLFALHDIDNGDKHHPVLVPVNLGITSRNIGNFALRNGRLLALGSRRGKHMVPIDDSPRPPGMVAPSDELRPILREGTGPEDRWLEFTSTHDDMEVYTTTPGAHVQADIKPALNLAFSDIEGFEGEPIVSVLHQMHGLVVGILNDFQKRFF